jgi:hypothetical protein
MLSPGFLDSLTCIDTLLTKCQSVLWLRVCSQCLWGCENKARGVKFSFLIFSLGSAGASWLLFWEAQLPSVLRCTQICSGSSRALACSLGVFSWAPCRWGKPFPWDFAQWEPLGLYSSICFFSQGILLGSLPFWNSASTQMTKNMQMSARNTFHEEWKPCTLHAFS